MNIQQAIKSARALRGWTQAELAYRAGVSLATLQNIESGRANPELSTIERLCSMLNIKMYFSTPIAMEELAAVGVPIMADKGFQRRPDIAYLHSVLSRLAESFDQMALNEREKDALLSYLWACKEHYPSVWRMVPTILKKIVDRQPFLGRHIKLRRIALQNLSAYL